MEDGLQCSGMRHAHTYPSLSAQGTHPASSSLARGGSKTNEHALKSHTHVIQYQGELLRCRHRQEMLGRKRDCWVLHWLGGRLQPLDRLEERNSQSGKRGTLGGEIPQEGCHMWSMPPSPLTGPLSSVHFRERDQPPTESQSYVDWSPPGLTEARLLSDHSFKKVLRYFSCCCWLDPLGLKYCPRSKKWGKKYIFKSRITPATYLVHFRFLWTFPCPEAKEGSTTSL